MCIVLVLLAENLSQEEPLEGEVGQRGYEQFADRTERVVQTSNVSKPVEYAVSFSL